jgi:hypothetical protein
MTGFRTKGWAAICALAVLTSLTAFAAPASAAGRDDAKMGDTCWVTVDSDAAPQCFEDEAAMAEAVLKQTGAIIQREGSETAARGLLATYLVAQFYTGSNYGGTSYYYFASDSDICDAGGPGKVGNFSGGANNSISSWHAYYGCAARVYDLTGQAGDQYGAFTNAASIGSGMDNRASSYRLT